MKAWLRWMGLAALFVMATGARAAELSGTWKGSFEFQGNSMPTTLNLKASGDAVSGTVEGLPNSPADIHEGKIEGDGVSFWVNTEYQGQPYKLVYKGKVTGDQIKFEFGTEDGSWASRLTVKKEAAEPLKALDLTGAWKGNFDFNGTAVPLTFNLANTGASVTGNVAGMGPAPTEIHDGKIEGNLVTFWLNTDYQGQTYALNYKGTVTGDQIDFSFGTPDGSWGAEVTVKK